MELAVEYSGPVERTAVTATVRSGRRRFEDILERHHAMLRRVASGVLSRPDAVDDVLQEAYLKAYRKLPSRFESDAHEAAWIYRVVYNCCLDELKRRRRRRDEGTLDPELAAAREHDPLDPVAVQAALEALAPHDRAVLYLIDFVGLDYDTAGSVLGVPRGTVASRLSAARARFRALFGESDG